MFSHAYFKAIHQVVPDRLRSVISESSGKTLRTKQPMTQSASQPAVIIPTLNAAGHLPALLIALQSQSLPPLEIIVIDSSSEDTTREIARAAGCRVERIPRAEFDHGKTRNQAARLARAEILVFLTQDALPGNSNFLKQLLEPIQSGRVAASIARQIPSEVASPLEVFNRLKRYPPQSRTCSLGLDGRAAMAAFPFSNVASAVKRAVFDQIGGFPEGYVVNEDMLFYARLLKADQTVAYQAEAVVVHTHPFNLRDQFQRFFDIGCFVSAAHEELGDLQLGNRGLRFVLEQIAFLVHQRAWFWIPLSLVEAGVKLVAFSLGHYAYHFPPAVAMRFSQQKSHWRR